MSGLNSRRLGPDTATVAGWQRVQAKHLVESKECCLPKQRLPASRLPAVLAMAAKAMAPQSTQASPLLKGDSCVSAAALPLCSLQMHFAATGISTHVTAVLFGGPNVGDAAFAADYNSRINTRNVDFVSDVVPQVKSSVLLQQELQHLQASAHVWLVL